MSDNQHTTLTMSPRELLKRGGLWSFALKFVAVALAFVAEALITNVLGLQAYDSWAAAVSWLSILTVVVALGMNTLLVRGLPHARVLEDFARMRGMIGWSVRRMFVAGVLLGVALFAARHAIAGGRPELAAVLAVVALMLPVQALRVHHEGVLRGLTHPVLSQLPSQIVRPLVLIAVVLAVVLLGHELSAPQLAWIWLGSLLLALACAAGWKRRVAPAELHSAVPRYDSKRWWAPARQLCFLQVAGMLISQADPAMLAALSGRGEAALYSVAHRISLLLSFGLMAVNVVVAPLISQLHASKQGAQLQALLTLAARGVALYTVPAALLLVALGPWLLSLFGPGFEAGYGPLCWLIAGRVLATLCGSVSILLVMTGHERLALKILGTAALGKLALNLLLLPSFGALGAAVATAFMLGLCNLWALREVRHRLQLEPTIYAVFSRR